MSALMRNTRLRAKMSVLQQPEAVSPDFGEQVADILAMLDGSYRIGDVDAHATPGEGAGLTPWVFGSSKGQSAQVAGARGLPFVASYHITPATALDAIDTYRAAFQPSVALSEPYVVVSADVVVADDNATARHLASSYGHWVYSIRAGDGAIPYPDPDAVEPLTDEQLELVKDRTATQFVGDADEVAAKLATLQRVTKADELVVTSVTHRHADRLRSHELLAKRWGL
jgi:luciferase family oxidoreductase group 1